MLFDDGGQLQTGTFLDYALPTAIEAPIFETIIVEVPAPDGPYGAKGIGEGPVCGAAAAVANALADATGVRYRMLPMTAPRIWRGMEDCCQEREERLERGDRDGLTGFAARA